MNTSIDTQYIILCIILPGGALMQAASTLKPWAYVKKSFFLNHIPFPNLSCMLGLNKEAIDSLNFLA